MNNEPQAIPTNLHTPGQRLAVVIVSWNVRELLRRCLQAVESSLAGSEFAHEVLVVDNASHDGTPAMVRAEFPAVRLIETGANLGFSGGNNVGLRALGFGGGSGPLPDYLLLLNPDTEPVNDAIPRLVRALAARPALVALGPCLRYPDGSVQSSRRRFPSRLTFFWESSSLDRWWPANPWARRYRYADVSDKLAQPVHWLVGAALLVRGAVIQRAGLLDERFFLYSEELEWQYRLQQTRGEVAKTGATFSHIWYLPEAEIIHHEGKSSEQIIARRHIAFATSRVLLARMWYGWRFAALLRLFLQAVYGYELLVEGLKLQLGHRPALRRERIGVYWQVLRALSEGS